MQNFRLAYEIPPFSKQISYQDNLFFIGSCFTENMYERFSGLKFACMQNPHGILFNPASILTALKAYELALPYQQEELVYLHETYRSWQHHDKFWGKTADECLNMINASTLAAHHFLKQANWVFVTLGSAWVYELGEKQEIVANCHRAPHSWFRRRLLKGEEVKNTLTEIVHILNKMQSAVNVVFTVSPVRHIREGFVENNRSKAALITAVHEVVEEHSQVFYFPSYELILDDLRDYRFFIEDMVHPNRMATHYVWEKLRDSLIQPRTLTQIKAVEKIVKAFQYQAINTDSQAHENFLSSSLQKVQELKKELPFLNWEAEEKYFGGNKDIIK